MILYELEQSPYNVKEGGAAKLCVWVFRCCNRYISLSVLLRCTPGWKG